MCHQFYVIDSCVVSDFFTSQATILVMSLPTKQWIKCLGQVHTPVIAVGLVPPTSRLPVSQSTNFYLEAFY